MQGDLMMTSIQDVPIRLLEADECNSLVGASQPVFFVDRGGWAASTSHPRPLLQPNFLM
jgi:hypothetical protein